MSFDLLTPVEVYHLNGTGNWTYSYRLFYDATVPYFGSRHLPYAITAVMVIIIFTILPVLLLILYPFRCFQKFLNLFPIRWYILHTFVDCFYGTYKDGTQPGTRDCRWFASLYFFTRFCLMFAGAYTENPMYFLAATMIFVTITLVFVTVQPFKENSSHFTTLNVFSLLLLAVWYTSAIGASESGTYSEKHPIAPYLVLMIVTLILPLFYISSVILHWMFRQRKFGTNIMAKLSAWRKGYDVIP